MRSPRRRTVSLITVAGYMLCCTLTLPSLFALTPFGAPAGPGNESLLNTLWKKSRPDLLGRSRDLELLESLPGASNATPPQSLAGKPFDFDGDRRADVSVWQDDTTHNWVVLRSSDNQIRTQLNWGSSALGDIAVPGDYDGDAKTDYAVYRPSEGNWYIVRSSNGGVLLRNWGGAGDKPVPCDYDGDRQTDIAVYRPQEGNWYILQSSDGAAIVRGWGAATDEVVPGDYDGDGRADLAVWRGGEGNWYIKKSSTGTLMVQWGAYGDKLVPADYDGDGKTDIAVWRPDEGNWYIRRSSDNGVTLRGWGGVGDVPVAADYDGDNKADLAVWRPSEGNWYIILSSNASVIMPNLGASTDFPVASAYVRTVVPPPNQSPEANAGGPYNAIPSVALQLDGSRSTDSDGIITNYEWNFGDGAKATGAKPKHVYATAGTKTLTLTVTDDRGGTSTVTTSVKVLSAEEADFANARLDPLNRTGDAAENPLSRNFNWSLPLLGLSGRAGLDLGLTLTYNSLVWTKAGSYIAYDLDNGYPGPGFRLGFPVIQKKYHNIRTNKDSFLMILPSGSRLELRRVGNTNGYESADSSYVQLIDNGALLVRTADGTQFSYALIGDEYQCTEIKDRNGNYISISYNAAGRIASIVDTLGRTITFNYDASGYLTSITQPWTVNDQQQTHTWARFTYSSPDLTINTSFSNLTIIGPQNNTTLKVLTEVKLSDDSSYKFLYSPYGQIYRITHYAPDSQPESNHTLAYLRYDLESPGAQDDCPRFTARYDQAENWNNNQEVLTSFTAPVPANWTTPDNVSRTGLSSQITMPDGTIHKIFAPSTGWDKGLLMRTETWAGGALKRWTAMNWTQEDMALSFPVNPRLIETSVGDPEGNRRRTTIDYQSFNLQSGTTCHLPKEVKEYGADAMTVLRYTRTEYNMAAAYTDRRIIGLVSRQSLYSGSDQLFSRIEYFYDESGYLLDQQTVLQHDAAYGTGFREGRGLLTSVRRSDADSPDDATKAVTYRMGYNVAGSVVFTRDSLWQPGEPNHQATISYADSFSDNNNARRTYAYPTTVTDEGGSISTAKYNYDFGAITREETPPPQGFTEGPVQIFEYDSMGRRTRASTLVNGNVYRYTRWEYPASQTIVNTYTTIQDGAGEAFSTTVFDGAGRVRATASELPNSAGGYSGRLFIYDVMGRLWKQSNPTETSASGPLWVATGEDQAAGWRYTTRTYDWKGRALRTTNVDGTFKETVYGGCGCAGGEVVTLIDETGRRERLFSDSAGRPWKTEILNTDQTIYSTTVNTYNVRDQLTSVRQYEGPETSGVYREAVLTYDGHGRLQTRKMPIQTSATHYTYNPDGTARVITDARGATSTYTYNTRHLLTGISYGKTANTPAYVMDAAAVTFGYDQAGNMTVMADALGSTTYSYDRLSRLTSETRGINGVGAFTLTYGYNLADELTSVTDAAGAQVGYSYDQVGRLTDVTGSGYAGVSSYASNLRYRAWGGLKGMTYGNGYTTSVGYNSRLQVESFEVAGRPSQYGPSTVMKSQYEYHPDGRLRSALDLLDDRFDRAYTYDHAGRLSEAYTGSEARDYLNHTTSGTQTGPYRQTYQHDVWGELTGRANRYWTQQTTFAASYLDGRNTDPQWLYDEAGNVLRDETLEFKHDAAGRNREVRSLDGRSTSVQEHDGTGEVVKRVEQRPTLKGPLTLTTYYLRSSVLGGRVITELGPQGQKLVGYVHAGGEVLAEQVAETVNWRHTNPLTGSRGESAREGRFITNSEADPMGINVGKENPFGAQAPAPGFEPLPGGAMLRAFSEGGQCSNSDPYCTTCTLNGFDVNCEWAGGFLARSGAGKIDEKTSPPGPRTIHGTSPIWGRFCVEVIAEGMTVSECTDEVVGYYGGGEVGTDVGARSLIQQNSKLTPMSQEEIEAIRNDMATMLADPTCKSFIEKLTNKALEQNPQLKPYSTDLIKVFDKVKDQPKGGYFWIPSYPGGGYASGGIQYNNARTVLVERSGYSPSASSEFVRIQFAMGGLHETIHHLGPNDGMLSEALATILREQGIESPPPGYFTGPYGGGYSFYWGYGLADACEPALKRELKKK